MLNNFVKIVRRLSKHLVIGLIVSVLLMLFVGFARFNFSTYLAKASNEATNSSQAVETLAPSVRLEDEPLSLEEEFHPKKDASGRYLEDRLTLKFKDGVDDVSKKSTVKKVNGKFTREDLDLLGAKEIKVDAGKVDSIINELKNEPSVEYVERVPVGYTDSCFPDDYFYCSGAQSRLSEIGVPLGWPFGRGSTSISIAVIDSGVEVDHPDFDPNRMIPGYNAVDNNYNVSDVYGHGTNVAGIIGAATNNDGYQIAGVNWYSKIIAMKATDDNGSSNANIFASAINYAANNYVALHNLKVINVSAHFNEYSNALSDAVENARARGVLVVAAAANSPMGQGGSCFIGFPAAYGGVISVVGVDSLNRHRTGCTNHVLNGVTYQKIQLAAPFDGLTLAKGGGLEWFASGTSIATPYVAGVASIVSSCMPGSAPLQIQQVLWNNATDIGPAGYDDTFGFGVVNLWRALSQTSCYTPRGDVNCNGVVNSTDALYILRYIAGLATGVTDTCPVNNPNRIFLPRADVNGNGSIDAVDALFVLHFVAGARNVQTLALIAPNVDSDGDGMTDQQEAQFTCLNPNVADAILDFDGDNLSNSSEIVLGSNPCIGDTDGDGFTDYAEFWVGTDPVLRCGENAWPADFVTGGIPDSTNRVNIMDLTSFLAPIRHINTSPGDVGYDRRWDLVPGKGVFTKDINISDLTALTILAPPMFNGQRAFNGPACTP